MELFFSILKWVAQKYSPRLGEYVKNKYKIKIDFTKKKGKIFFYLSLVCVSAFWFFVLCLDSDGEIFLPLLGATGFLTFTVIIFEIYFKIRRTYSEKAANIFLIILTVAIFLVPLAVGIIILTFFKNLL